MNPRLLDLFCGGGGAAMGYHQAGFEVVGIDLIAQPHYPFTFEQADALTYPLTGFDVIHCSPPCQAYSVLKGLTTREMPQLITDVRNRLIASGQYYVIENVIGAPLRDALMLCGSMFDRQTACGAQLRRHRRFESNVLLMSPGPCRHARETIGVVGHAYRNEALRMQRRRTISITGSTPQRQAEDNRRRETFSIGEARRAMGIPWMTMAELSQAIPPDYTEWIGHQLIEALRAVAHDD